MPLTAEHHAGADALANSTARVVVLRGPAASGKTSAVLAHYRRHLRNDGRPGGIILAPNAPAADRLRRIIVSESPNGVAMAPGVTSFVTLAGRVTAAAEPTAALIAPYQRHLLLRQIIDKLAAEKKLTALGPVADTPGIVAALDRAIAELKRAAVEPDHLAAALDRRDAKGHDLLAVYRRYQQQLHADDLYDLEGRMWQARDFLKEWAAQAPSAVPSTAGLADVEFITVDGFTDFTPTQLDMLASLSKLVRQVIVTLPYAEDGRSRLWHWTNRTLNHLRRAFGEDLAEIAITLPTNKPLGALCGSLFDMDAPTAGATDDLHVVAATGSDSEIAYVARHVKRLLADGEPAGNIAVIARDITPYRLAIQRIFTEHDIPIAPPPETLGDAPIVRFLLSAAGMGPEFGFRSVLATIRNSYFRPQALGPYDETTVAAAETIIREGNVLASREAYALAALRLANRIEPTGEDVSGTPISAGHAQHLNAAAEMLGIFFDRVADVNDVAGLIGLADFLELRQSAMEQGTPQRIARDLRTLAALDDTLAKLSAETPLVHLHAALDQASCPVARGEALVDVLDALDARPIRYRHVFLIGASEGNFPRRFNDAPLLSQAQRAALASRSIVLDSRDDLACREMLLFYLACSRADASLTVSYTEEDAFARAGAPSAFLESLLEPIGGLETAFGNGTGIKLSPGELLPPPNKIASRRDGLLATVAGPFDDNGQMWPIASEWAARHVPGALRLAGRGLWALHARWAPGEPTAYDGRLDDPEILKQFARRYFGKHVFSASQLDTYGRCPWQFFAHYVLKLSPLGEPQRHLEPVTRGLYYHDVLFRIMTALRDATGGAVRLSDVDESHLLETLDAAVAAADAAVESRRSPYPMLWQLQRARMRQDLAAYLLAQHRQTDLSTESLHFELGFGLPDRPTDPAGQDAPVTIGTPSGDLLLQGRIDRVDHVCFDDLDGLMIVDYKSGSLPGKKDFDSGRNVQAAVYSIAAEQLLNQRCMGGAFHKIGGKMKESFFAAVERKRGRLQVAEDFGDRFAAAIERVGKFVAGMSAGQFDAAPTHDCPSYCPFRQICNYSPARSEITAAGGAL